MVSARVGWPTEQGKAAALADELCKSVAMIVTPTDYQAMLRRNAPISRQTAALDTIANGPGGRTDPGAMI